MKLQINLAKLPWNRPQKSYQYSIWGRFHLDPSLLFATIVFAICGLFILYSASNESLVIVEKQALWFVFAFIALFVFAQIPPSTYRVWAPWFFIISIFLLILVLIMGHIGKGAQRWLSLGIFKFQPSELMKIGLPLMLAWYFSDKPLPPNNKQLLAASGMIILPALLIAKQPDLGTAILILASGFCVILLAGISWRVIAALLALALAAMPLLWHFMRDYQRDRVLTFLNPERDPLGAGYHIIQSKIAIGSGGILGKGWLHGSQSHLQFLPEHATDFIFAVCGEEFGLIGALLLLSIYLFIVTRCLVIASQAQDTFTRLFAGSLALIFFMSIFINIGMVTGILPVVGLPLPLVSYGGTSVVTVLAAFGIIMSIHTHRNLVSS